MKSAGQGVFYGWYLVPTACSIYLFTNGMILFVPQNLFPRYIETFGVTAGQVSLTTGLSLGLAALLAPLIGAVIDRTGVVRAIRTGIVISAVCFSLYPFARTINELYVLHSLLALSFALSGLLANVVLLSNWFVRRRGAVVGLLAAGSSLAGGLLPVLISPLVVHPDFGWRWGYGALAISFWLLAVLPGLILLRETPAEVGAYPDGAAQPPPDAPQTGERHGSTFTEALRTRSLWCLAIGSACVWYAIQSMNSQVTIFLEQEAGMTPARATLMFASIFWFSMVGKFAFGALSDRFAKRRVMLITTLVLLVGCLLIFETGADGPRLTLDQTRLWIFVAVFGLGFGGSFTMIQLVTVETFGQRALGKILGTVTLIDALGAAAGTVISGQLRTATGGYLVPFAVIALVALAGVINVTLIRPVQHRQAAAVGSRPPAPAG